MKAEYLEDIKEEYEEVSVLYSLFGCLCQYKEDDFSVQDLFYYKLFQTWQENKENLLIDSFSLIMIIHVYVYSCCLKALLIQKLKSKVVVIVLI